MQLSATQSAVNGLKFICTALPCSILLAEKLLIPARIKKADGCILQRCPRCGGHRRDGSGGCGDEGRRARGAQGSDGRREARGPGLAGPKREAVVDQ